MVDTWFSTMYLTLKSIKDIYAELQKITPNTLGMLVSFLEPFYDAQHVLEGDKYPAVHLVLLWAERFSHASTACTPVEGKNAKVHHRSPQSCNIPLAQI